MCNNKTNNLLRKRFRTFYPVVIDIETAGFNPETDAILEIAIITLKMNKLGLLEKENLLHFHVQPFQGAQIDKNSIAFHGIDPFSPLRGAISEYEALYSIFDLVQEGIKLNNCTKSIIVAHNAIFDHNFLTAAITRTGIKNNPFHSFVIFDTATLSGLAVGQTVLARACKAIGVNFDNNQAHSALYDTQRTADLFCKIVNRWKTLGGWPPNDLHTNTNPK